jgi:hypothetical protein
MTVVTRRVDRTLARPPTVYIRDLPSISPVAIHNTTPNDQTTTHGCVHPPPPTSVNDQLGVRKELTAGRPRFRAKKLGRKTRGFRVGFLAQANPIAAALLPWG